MTPLLSKTIFLLGLVAYSWVRIYFWLRVRRVPIVTQRHRRSGTALVLIVGLGMILLPLAYLVRGDWFAEANHAFHPLAAWLGALLYLTSTWLLVESHRALDTQWSPILELKERHRLITTGIYAQIRHPMYTAFWGYAVGQFCLLPNWAAGLSGICAFALLYFIRVPREEQMMRQEFGNAYEQYMALTGRIFPRLRLRSH